MVTLDPTLPIAPVSFGPTPVASVPRAGLAGELDDQSLWMRTVEAALSSGRSVDHAITIGDRVISELWRRRGTRVSGAPTRAAGPGLAKCRGGRLARPSARHSSSV